MTRPPAAATGRAALPTGTVTFLFTDVEGSTRLAEHLGTRWPAVLERHRAILRTAVEAHGGLEVQTEGDGLFAVFTSAPAAVAAAARAQRDLAVEPWPEDAPVRVRMGLHAGEGRLDGEGLYVGHDVHRAARVAAAAHGGQVLASETVRALADATLGPGLAFRDLGEHRLKDLRPQPLAQLDVDGLRIDFPPVRSLDARPNNLPTHLTSFIGRDAELAAAERLLAGTRLLTLTGPGGTGKTRLALQLAAAVADAYPDGTWFVPLEPLRDPDLVLPTVARTLGVVPRPDQSALDALAAALGEQRTLLVLDNFEQVVAAAPGIGDLLRACPGVRVVVTSRAVLRIAGEQEYLVGGLPAPPDPRRLSRVELENLPLELRGSDPDAVGQYEAVRLFVARAVAVRPDFRVDNENAPAVAGICARLQGMPLAIELAAARVKLLSPEQILDRLEGQLGVLTSTSRDLPDRQRTLRGAIAWSCDLLDEPHRRLLARLAVFRGGWDLAAAEAVVAAPGGPAVDVLDGLAELVDQSLVRSTDGDGGDDAAGPRFDMFESIREFAAEMLEAAGDAAAARAAHGTFFVERAESLAPLLQGAEQRRHLDRLEHDHDNLRAALGWAAEVPEPELVARLVHALWRFWQQRGYLSEARRTLEQLAARDLPMPPVAAARFAEAFGGIAYWQADLPAAAQWYDVALAAWRERAAGGTADDRRELANALYNRGYVGVAETMGRSATPDAAALPMLEEALAIYRELGDGSGEGNALWGLAGYWMFAEDPASAEPLFREAVELHRAAGHRTMEAWSLHMLSTAIVMLHRPEEAGEVSRHALRHFHDAGDVSGITLAFDTLSAIALANGDRDRGARLWGAARHLQRASGTGLASWDEQIFARMPWGVRSALDPADLERLAAEGAALPLAEAVAYALGERDPFAGA